MQKKKTASSACGRKTPKTNEHAPIASIQQADSEPTSSEFLRSRMNDFRKPAIRCASMSCRDSSFNEPPAHNNATTTESESARRSERRKKAPKISTQRTNAQRRRRNETRSDTATHAFVRTFLVVFHQIIQLGFARRYAKQSLFQ